MTNSNYISTEEEKAIAKKLSVMRSKIYLESRAFIRDCISNLLNKNPLEITLKAYPGAIPKIPKEYGNISMSHTNNALVVVWHKEKVGIDIEKSDRKFNYQCLAKKYFKNNFEIKNNERLKKKDVLDYWSAIEAAIKWNGGKLANDLKEWKYNKDKNIILHKNKNLKLQLNQLVYKEWTISVATQSKESLTNDLIICDEDTNFS